MSCSICLQAYAEDRKPRILSCGHYFCTPCLKNLHCMNNRVIPCPQCGGEEYHADVEKLIIVLGLEARVTSLSLEEPQKETVHAGDPAKGVKPMWGNCSLHRIPMSSWCKTCHLSLCDNCKQLHLGQEHKVFDHRQARELLLSKYDSCNRRSFHQWLVGVERATRETINAAEALVPLLRPTLLTVQDYLSQMKDQKKAMETTSSLKTLEYLLEESSRWRKRTQLAAQQKVKVAVTDLGRVESSMVELRRLQREIEVDFAQSGAAAASPTEEEKEERQDTAPPRAVAAAGPQVVAQSGLVSLSRGQTMTLDLPPDLGTRCTTELDIRATSGEWIVGGFLVTYENDAGCPLFRTVWDFVDDRVRMATHNPITLRKETEVPWKERCGLQWEASHQIRIFEDLAQYAVLLDGVAVGFVDKADFHPSIATRIKVESLGCQIDVSKFLVEVEGAMVS